MISINVVTTITWKVVCCNMNISFQGTADDVKCNVCKLRIVGNHHGCLWSVVLAVTGVSFPQRYGCTMGDHD